MTEEEKKKLADAEKAAADAKKALDDAKTAHATELAAKDAIIAQKNNDVVGARKEYKKLADMTQAEKDAMSAKELELQERTEAHEADVNKFKEDQAASLKKEVDARKERAVARIAGNDKELAQKVRDNYAKIVDSDKAQTDEEVKAMTESAMNMTGQPRPDPIRNAMQGGGDGLAPNDTEKGSFAESKEGKDLSAAMGLPEIKPPAPAPAAT